MQRPLTCAKAGIVLAVLAIPSLALAVDLTTAGGFVFDIQADDDGAVYDGTGNAYDNAYELIVDGTRYDVDGAAHTTSLGGQQIEMAEVMMSGLAVRRLIYVPAGGGDYARYLDILVNPGTTDITTVVRIEGDVGNAPSAPVTATSSGDTTFDLADFWLVTEPDSDGSGDPTTSHVVQGAGALEPITSAEINSDDDYEWQFDLTVPAGGRVAVLSYTVQANTTAAATAEAERLASLPGDAIVGLDAYALDIVNFKLGGAPFVAFGGPFEADEGAELTIEANVVDVEGDPATWSWDLDGDGTFGELPDTATYVVPAGSTDGDSELTLAVQTSDGTETRIVSKTIQINNVAPVITSEPPTMASGAEYQYQVEVDEPSAFDPLVFRLGGSVAPGMVISADGLITWTPPPAARGRTYTTVVQVLDGDHGVDLQEWDITVGLNTPPEPAMPVSPLEFARVSPAEPVTLVAENGSDADGDRLTYSFQIAPGATFETGLIGSGDLPEGEGMTSWTTTEPLAPGVWYWRVSVSDGNTTSLYRFGEFIVGEAMEVPGDAGPQTGADAGVPDAGPITPPSGGCSAAPGENGSAGWMFAMLALMFLVARSSARRQALRRREAN